MDIIKVKKTVFDALQWEKIEDVNGQLFKIKDGVVVQYQWTLEDGFPNQETQN